MKGKKRKIEWILYMATYPPRECGIATFTKDLAKAMEDVSTLAIKPKSLAMNDNETNIYNYPNEVIFQIDDANIQEYMDIAKKVNEEDRIKLVNIQHEFGIFGGKYGSYLIPFLEILEKPVVTTFHTVLPHPKKLRKKIVQLIAEKSVALVVMTHKAADVLTRDYGVKTPIKVIPHGAPSVSFNPDNTKEKTKLGLKDKVILSSFGMMNRGKGYEYVIDSLPEVIEKFPNLLYLIIGETHPVVRKKRGEGYRNFLERKVKELGLEDHVKFYNKYLKLSEIIKYLRATDVYISSALHPDQAVSGTLSYALGCGKAIVSTPFLHAREGVTPERGILIDDFKNPKLFTEAILKILSNPELRKEMEKKAYSYSRKTTWPSVALSYLKAFDEYLAPKEYEKVPPLLLPKVKIGHLVSLTDGFGIIQFARHTKADKASGYTLDDNSRALIFGAMHYNVFESRSILRLIRIYLNFIKYVQGEDEKFYNFVNKAREINYNSWSEDAHGRTMWALGYLTSLKSLPKELRDEAEKLLTKGMKWLRSIKSPRAIAFSIIGLYFYHKAQPSSKKKIKIRKLADGLLSLYKKQSSEEWEWFEEYLTYANSKLPESLFYAYLATQDKKYLRVAKSTLDFLISLTFEKEIFTPIGQQGWYFRNGKRAYFYQQPVNTASMVQTLILANKITKEKRYKRDAIIAFQWFLGKNSLNQMVYDDSTGGCYDGLGKSSINFNQGAESTISYLLARLSLTELDNRQSTSSPILL